VVDNDDAGAASGAGGPGVVGLDFVALVALDGDGLGGECRVRHG
jgi:hypothetical protein